MPEGNTVKPLRELVVMVRRSAGNAETGTAWTETAIFPETATLGDILEWLPENDMGGNPSPVLNYGDVTIQFAQRPMEALPKDMRPF